MSKYKEIRGGGVLDTTTGKALKPTDVEWYAYAQFLKKGGVPDPDDSPVVSVLPDLATAKAQVTASIELLASQKRALVTQRSSPQEMASWTIKMQQAQAFNASQNEADAPLVVAEAQYRGITTAELVTKILQNASDFQNAEAVIAGLTGRHKDAVAALTDVEQVLSYDFRTGWPF